MGLPVDIIIPVYNEQDNLPGFYHQLSSIPLTLHPIFIDNGSSDASLAILKTIEGATIIEHKSNRGYGASLRAGIMRATSEKVVIIDADGEYHPEVIPEIIRQLDNYEVVHTSRFLGKRNRDMTKLRYLGNICITFIFNLLFQQKLTDLYTGCKGYRRLSVKNIELYRNGFEHVLEISARLARQKVTIKEIPVRYNERQKGVSKMNHLPETAKYLLLVMYYSLTFRRK